MRTLISISSEQTLPNVLFIKQFGAFDRYVFLTTDRMEEKGVTRWVTQTCGIVNYELLNVHAEQIDRISEAWETFAFYPHDQLTVHLTGGTKMMALATYSFFTNLPKPPQIYYKPLREDDFLQIFPQPDTVPVKVQLNLLEYLSAYGVTVKEAHQLSAHQSKISVAKQLMQQIRKGNVPLEITQALHANYKEKDKMFLTGGWLELWLANYIQQHFKLKQDAIRFNIRLTRTTKKSQENTEYDVMYVHNNRLYVAECKYFSGGKFLKSKINKDWYKLAGLQLHIGLYATPFLISACKMSPSVRQYLTDSHRLFRIKAFADIDTIGNPSKFNHFLNNL
ncbi:MAG: DUF1887 family CARF protein [Bacteroidetes bacterium]|nr:DUF1887 family CARF protein [Bacteroidota bacterium]